MLTIHPSTAAPNKPGHQTSLLTSLGDENAQNVLGSFGEVLSRSLTPPQGTTASVVTKFAGNTPARRQSGNQKIAPEDLVNVMGLNFVPPENRVVKFATGGGVAASTTNSDPGDVIGHLSSRVVGTSEPTDGSATAKNDRTAVTAPPEPLILASAPAIVAVSQNSAGQVTPSDRVKPQSDRLLIRPDSEKNTIEFTEPPNGDRNELTDGDNKVVKKPGDLPEEGSNWSPAATARSARPDSVSDIASTVTTSASNTSVGSTPPLPPDTLNHVPRAGLRFGFPYCHAGTLPDTEFGHLRSCSEFTPPAQNLGPHVASLGMRFYTGTQFPVAFRNRIFIAEHGSWNRSRKIGYRVTMVTLDGNKAVRYETFAEGWLQGERAWGRPADVLVAPDGSLLVSDDDAGAIYRIRYNGQ